jgi:hypothetical protein
MRDWDRSAMITSLTFPHNGHPTSLRRQTVKKSTYQKTQSTGFL